MGSDENFFLAELRSARRESALAPVAQRRAGEDDSEQAGRPGAGLLQRTAVLVLVDEMVKEKNRHAGENSDEEALGGRPFDSRLIASAENHHIA